MSITDETIELLCSPEMKDYIRQNEHADVRALVLRHKTIYGIPSSVVADQIRGRSKAKEKLPLWFDTPGIVYSPTINLEQCSSYRTANYKLEILNSLGIGRKLCVADLTGGFGVDCYYFSRLCSQVHYVEKDPDLAAIAKHNHQLLGASNIQYHVMTAEMFLEQSIEQLDLIYIDPSRRKDNRRVVSFAECEPNIISLKKKIFSYSPFLLIKASPLLDIHAGMEELKDVQNIYLVSVDNECREVLFLCKDRYANEARLTAINFTGTSHQQLTFFLIEEQHDRISYSEPLEFLYEPNASILKAGAFKLAGTTYRLKKIHPNTHLYTSNRIEQEFPGRIFRILHHVRGRPEVLAQIIPDGHANVISRNYPLTPDQLKKKLRLKDGGEKYLIAFTSHEGRKMVVAERIA